MRRQWQAGLIIMLMLLGPTVWAQRFDSRDVEVEVVNDRGRTVSTISGATRAGARRSIRLIWKRASGSNYSVQIRNRSDQRIGVVIAVDGRNVISGDRSHLSPNERMYVLNPVSAGDLRRLAHRQESGQPFLFHRRGRFLRGGLGRFFGDGGDRGGGVPGKRALCTAAVRKVGPRL